MVQKKKGKKRSNNKDITLEVFSASSSTNSKIAMSCWKKISPNTTSDTSIETRLIETDRVLLSTQCFPWNPVDAGFQPRVMNAVWKNIAFLRNRGLTKDRIKDQYYDYFLEQNGGSSSLRDTVMRLGKIHKSSLDPSAAKEMLNMMTHYCEQLEKAEDSRQPQTFAKMLSYNAKKVIVEAATTADECHNVAQLHMEEVLRFFIADPTSNSIRHELSLNRLVKALKEFGGMERIVTHNLVQLRLLTKRQTNFLSNKVTVWRKTNVLVTDSHTLKQIIYLLYMALTFSVWLDQSWMRFKIQEFSHTRWVKFIAAAQETKYYNDMHAFATQSTICTLTCALADDCVITSQRNS